MTSSRSTCAGLAFATAILFSPSALADDWTAVKLRGVVLEQVDGDWVKLKRGAVVSDERLVRTMASGRVTFERGAETIDLGPRTLVQIFDRAGRSKHTTVKQHYGHIAVEAEVREVTHFSVQTPHLAAVVKGTRFVVTSGEDRARVQVERGAVAVEDAADHSVVIVAGQEAESGAGSVMTVAGQGELPQVVDARGRPVTPRAEEVRTVNAGGANARAEEARNRADRAGGSNSNSGRNGNSNGGGNGSSGNSGGGSGNSGGGSGGNSGSGNSGSNGGGNGKN